MTTGRSPPSTSAPPADGSSSVTSAPTRSRRDRSRAFPTTPCSSSTDCTGTSSGCTAPRSNGLRDALRAEPAIRSIGVDSWAVDYGLLRGGPAARQPVPLPRCPHRARRRGRPRSDAARRALRAQRAAVPPVQHAVPVRGGDRRSSRLRRQRTAHPRPVRVLAHRCGARRADERLDDGPAPRRRRRLGRRAHRRAGTAARHPALAHRTGRAARRPAARGRRGASAPAPMPRSPRSARTTRPRPCVAVPMRAGCRRLHLVRHLGPGRRGGRRGRCSPPRRSRRELHERGRRGRPRPPPAQHHGAVGAERGRAHVGARRAPDRPVRRCSTPPRRSPARFRSST